MDDNTRAVIDRIEQRFEDRFAEHRAEWRDWAERRDRVLFGPDGRGGLVADTNAAKQRSKLAMWVASSVLAPVIVGLVMLWLTA